MLGVNDEINHTVRTGLIFLPSVAEVENLWKSIIDFEKFFNLNEALV